MKKRILALLLAGCMAVSLSACGKSETRTEDTEAAESAEEIVDEATAVDTSALGTSTLTELGTYTGIEYTPMLVEVTDDEVETEVQSMLSNAQTLEEVTDHDIVAEGDVANIDYEGKKDGVAFDGGTAAGTDITVGSSGFIDGFDEGVRGMKVGETKDVPMTFPENYREESLAGADVVFTITVNKIQKYVTPELNDDFAVESGYESVDDLYASIREELTASKEEEAKSDAEYQIIQAVIDASTFDLKDDELALYNNDMIATYESYASMYGTDYETFVSTYMKMSVEDFEAQCTTISTYRIESALVRAAIAEAENMSITGEEYQAGVEKYMEYYQYESQEEFEADYNKEEIEKQVLFDKVTAFLVENAVAGEPAAPTEETAQDAEIAEDAGLADEAE